MFDASRVSGRAEVVILGLVLGDPPLSPSFSPERSGFNFRSLSERKMLQVFQREMLSSASVAVRVLCLSPLTDLKSLLHFSVLPEAREKPVKKIKVANLYILNIL